MEIEEKSYRVIYSKQLTVGLVLFLLPMTVILTAVFIAISFGNLPDWALITMIIGSIVLSLALTLYVVFKMLSINCTVKINSKEFSYELDKTNLFYRTKYLKTGWENIRNVSFNQVKENNRSFAQIAFNSANGTITFSPLKGESANEMEWEFWIDLNQRVNDFNSTNPSHKIKDKGFYKSKGAMVLSVIAILVIVVVTGYKIIEPNSSPPWYRLFALYAFTGLWFSNYISARKRRKK